MTIANDIISRRMPDFEHYIREGETLDDIDEYGFTPLIEAIITQQVDIIEALLARGIDINKPDVTGRTALHWAVDNHDIELSALLLERGANANAYTSAGLSVLVYPVLRAQDTLKQLLYNYGAKLDFALDLSGVDYMSSRGLRVLTLARREAETHKIAFTLAKPNERMREILAISRYDKIFKIEDSLD